MLALLDDGNHAGDERIAPLAASSREEYLAPTDATSEEWVKSLHETGALVVDPGSDIRAFDRNDGFAIHDYSRVCWRANLTLGNGERCTRESLYLALYQELSSPVQPAWKSELYSLIFNIARQEVTQYIHVLANEANLGFSAQASADSVVGQLLQNFSVSQIYYFVRLAVRNAAHFYATGNSKGRAHASNTIPRSLQNTAQNALTEGWRKDSYRDSRVPQSALHRLLYDVVLKDSGAGFSRSPGIYWRETLVPRFLASAPTSDCSTVSAELFCRECDSPNIDVSMDKLILRTHCYDCATISRFRAYEELPD